METLVFITQAEFLVVLVILELWKLDLRPYPISYKKSKYWTSHGQAWYTENHTALVKKTQTELLVVLFFTGLWTLDLRAHLSIYKNSTCLDNLSKL